MRRFLTAAAALSLLVGAPTTMADHNSVWGEDWATDTMDVHDARFDSLNDDSITGSEFLAEVQSTIERLGNLHQDSRKAA